MRLTILYIAIFGAGLGIGAFADRDLTRPPQSTIDKEWQRLFNEESSHVRIIALQHALMGAGSANDLATLSKQIEAQLGVQDLIIRSREAEYAKITPLSAIIVPLLSAIAGGIITTVLGRKMRHSAG